MTPEELERILQSQGDRQRIIVSGGDLGLTIAVGVICLLIAGFCYVMYS